MNKVSDNTYMSASAPKKKGKKKLAVIAGVAATFMIPAAAWAAVELFGFGTIDAAASTTQNLVVDPASVQLTNKLVPGQTVGAKAIVNNPNDFPVTVTGVLVQDSSVATNPASVECANTVHLVTTGAGPTYPGAGGGASSKQAIAAPVTIAPGASVWITVPASVKQDASATQLCGVKANFAVVGQIGS